MKKLAWVLAIGLFLLFIGTKIVGELNVSATSVLAEKPAEPVRAAAATVIPPPKTEESPGVAPTPPAAPSPEPAPVPIAKQVADAIAGGNYEFAQNLLLPDRIAEVKAALKADPNVKALSAKGDSAARDGHTDEAIIIYRLSRTLTGRPSTAILDGLERRRAAANAAERAKAEGHAAAETWLNEVDRLQRGTDSNAGLHVAVEGLKVRKSISSGAMSYSREGTGRFIVVDIVVTNRADRVTHVNPLYFTLSTCGNDMNADELSWGLSDRLQPTNVTPGNRIRGKLIFPTDTRCDDNTLNYLAGADRAFLALPAVSVVR